MSDLGVLRAAPATHLLRSRSRRRRDRNQPRPPRPPSPQHRTIAPVLHTRAHASKSLRGWLTTCWEQISRDLITPPRQGSGVLWWACLSTCVCLSVHDHIFGSTRPIFTNCFCALIGSVLLWRRSDTLCTSGFMDDVIFAHKPKLLDVAAPLKRSVHATLCLAIKCA